MIVEKASTAAESAERSQAATERAVHAWKAFTPESPAPTRVDILKRPGRNAKSVVVGLGAVGPGGMSVVAKELLDDACDMELAIYRRVLPEVSVAGPELIGSVPSSRVGRTWLFLEAITGAPFDKTDPKHVAIASRWLATFHSESTTGGLEGALPERGVDHYLSLAARALSDLVEVSGNPTLTSEQVCLLTDIARLLESVLRFPDGLTAAYASFPVSLVHGDFKGNNMAFVVEYGDLKLRVFDWSESHWGPMVADLWSVDGGVYRTALKEAGWNHTSETIEEWILFGSLLRWISSISWELPGLRYRWVERPMRRMAIYEDRLRAAIDSSPWVA